MNGYTCYQCGKKLADADDYLLHLEADHPGSWLARRTRAERAAKAKAKPEIGEHGTR